MTKETCLGSLAMPFKEKGQSVTDGLFVVEEFQQ